MFRFQIHLLFRRFFVLWLPLFLFLPSLHGQTQKYIVEINAAGKTFDGILLSKPDSSAVHYVLLSKTGLKIFDLIAGDIPEMYRFHYILPDLNRKIVKRSTGRAFFIFALGKISGAGKLKIGTVPGKTVVFVFNDNGKLLKKRGFGIFRNRIRVFMEKNEILIKQPGLKIKLTLIKR